MELDGTGCKQEQDSHNMPFTSDKTRQGAAGVSTGFEIPYSCRFEGVDNTAGGAYLSRTFSASNRKTWTLSCWIKLGLVVGYRTIFAQKDSSAQNGEIYLDGTSNPGSLYWHLGGASNIRSYSSPKLKDPSAWYHLVFSLDTTDGTPANRQRFYLNGEQITDFDGYAPTPDEDYEGNINKNEQHEIGGRDGTNNFFNGHMAEVHFIDGTALTPTSFGESGDYGEWKPKKVAGLTYGTNGFYLDFADSSALGNDVSGENNDWTVANLVATDQMLDSPTNNFATMNANDRSIDNSTVLSEGNLKCVQDYTSDRRTVRATMGNSTGKWYFECLIVAGGDGVWSHGDIGILNVQDDIDRNNVYLYDTGWWHENQGQTYNGASAENTSLSAVGNGDIVQVAYDLDASKIWFGRNNTWILSGDPAAGSNETYDNLSGTLAPACDMMESNSNGTFVFNFGQDSSFAGVKTAAGNQDDNSIGDFYYDVPAGFMALCTSNLPAVAVIPQDNFNTVLYTGTGSSNDVTGVGFTPEMTVISEREESEVVSVVDILRGSGVTELIWGSTAAETDDVQKITAILSDGFTVGTSFAANHTDHPHVSWHWKAGGSGSANTVGSSDSVVSVNTDMGFSIVTYTGQSGNQTIGHGLGVVPEIVLVKDRTAAGDEWAMYHANNTAAPETDYLRFDNDAGTADNIFWNDTAPTATVFYVDDTRVTNSGHGEDYVAYCFHSVDGMTKVGSYIGNADADGTFVYTGFRPAWILIKNTGVNHEWSIFDNKRNTYNPATLSQGTRGYAENTSQGSVDFLSNGFKMRASTNHTNESDETMVYLAFAETPFKYSNAR